MRGFDAGRGRRFSDEGKKKEEKENWFEMTPHVKDH